MSRSTGRYALAAAAVLAIGVPSVAVGFGEGEFLKLGKRNPSANGTLALSAETEIIADTTTYGTRQSNKRDGDGGGAIYGCRSNPGAEPCIRSNNLKGGRAFEFVTTGKEAGRIDLGDPTGAPFTTNATGVATGLNADRLDGRDVTDLAPAGAFKWAVVDAAGKLAASRRGATDSKVFNETTGTYSVTFDRDVSDCSYSVTANGDTANANVAFAARPAPGDPRSVLVDQADDAADRSAFHLQVVC